MSTAADNITLNPGSGGPSVHTDYISGTGHVQYVKLDIGGNNATSPITSTNALPVQLYGLKSNWTTVPVGGGTNGQAIPISGTISVGAVSITGGTLNRILEGVSADIRTFAEGVTVSVLTEGANTVGITVGDLNIGTIALPTSFTSGIKNCGASDGGTFAGFTCSSGVKIKNLLKSTGTINGGGLACIGISASGFVNGRTAEKYALFPGEEVFMEITNLNTLRVTGVSIGADENSVITFQAS